jgi:hypothetical protein
MQIHIGQQLPELVSLTVRLGFEWASFRSAS